MSNSRHRRSQVELRRRRAKQEERARATQTSQDVAAFRLAYEQQRRKKIIAWVCFALAPIIFFSHMIEHSGAFQLYNKTLEDLTIGYPTAFLLVIIGFRQL